MRLLINILYAFCLIIGVTVTNNVTAENFKIPQPPPFSGNDSKNFNKALIALDRGKYSKALAISKIINDQSAREIIKWITYTDPYSFPSFFNISNFINSHRDWPRQSSLLSTADRALAAKKNDTPVLEWYRWQDPVSKQGRLRLAEALLREGNKDRAKIFISKSWLLDHYSRKDLLITEKKYREFLTKDNHLARLDQLLWNNKEVAAKQMFRFVDSKYKDLAIARLALRNFYRGVDAAIAKLPEQLKKDPGLKYERVRWRRKKGKNESSREILFNSPDNLVKPRLWWHERKIQVRNLIKSEKYDQAYLLAAEHGQMHATTFSEAEWLSGWISLRLLNEPLMALNHFSSIYDAVVMPISRARSSYWAGRASDVAGNKLTAEKWFKVAARYCTTFYGQLAIELIRKSEASKPECVEQNTNIAISSSLKNHALFSAARRLAFVGRDQLVRSILLKLGELAKTSNDFSHISSLAKELQRPDLAIAAAKRASRDGYHNEKYLFPVPLVPFALADNDLEHALVLAVIRQESQFYNDAISRAGARGLMQLMPRTAKSVAKIHQLEFSKSQLTRDPSYNIKLGSEYLYSLIENYDGSYALALAAYNAGPGNLSRWFNTYGDPRKNTNIDIIDWIEKIPLQETRNYIQRVIEGLQVYRRLMKNNKHGFNIESDLRRGIIK